jgi:hypothetical protein
MAPLLEIFKQIEQKSSYKFIPPIPALLEEIEDERVKNIVMPHLHLIEKEIQNLLETIKNCKKFEETQGYFDLLQKTIEALEGLVYKRKIEISDPLLKFFKDFDRIDDIRERQYFYNEIKNENYSL